MSTLNQTPSGERVHIAFFGKRNVGKSSLVNAFTGQDLAIVSSVKGTTTDPVYKAMELLPMGPVMIIDTPGIDDEGDLGLLRVKKTRAVLNKADIAIIVTDGTHPLDGDVEALVSSVKEKGIPYVIVRNKADLLPTVPEADGNLIWVSAEKKINIVSLREKVASLTASEEAKRRIVGDLLSPEDVVVLVVPIDKAAPKGRLILPQQQTIRDILDSGASALVCRDSELTATIGKLSSPPRMVITDSQVFGKVKSLVPENVELTSFSILMARYKGDLALAVEGATALNDIKSGDRILIAEGCTHHRQCEDIGTVKLPTWIKKHTGAEPEFVFTSGGEFPDELDSFKLVVHCGGCMLNEREMRYRLRCCRDRGIPVTNYGILIAYMNGILSRTVEPFRDVAEILKK